VVELDFVEAVLGHHMWKIRVELFKAVFRQGRLILILIQVSDWSCEIVFALEEFIVYLFTRNFLKLWLYWLCKDLLDYI